LNPGLIIIAGATGFIGRALVRSLDGDGYEIAVLTRDREKAKRLFGSRVLAFEWDGRTSAGWLEAAQNGRAIVNLAGENIGAGRWTKERKSRIVSSRLNAGRAIVEALAGLPPGPRTLVQASAVGFYGPRGDEELDESSPPGAGFLAETVRAWEASTREAEAFGVRQVIVRSGLVLDEDGGVLPRFLRQFRSFAGGPLGSGKQWLSWIHLEDEVRAIRFLLEREDLRGGFNLTAPRPVRMREFARTLGRVMKRPAFFRVPAFVLHVLFGQMADETLLGGQKVSPRALSRAGFSFSHPELAAALLEIMGKRGRPR
jgi:hypothetical protein